MRAFYEAFSIGIAIFACLLFVITMGKAFMGDLALWQWIALVFSEITLFGRATFYRCEERIQDV